MVRVRPTAPVSTDLMTAVSTESDALLTVTFANIGSFSSVGSELSHFTM